jgi:hypothetical protein
MMRSLICFLALILIAGAARAQQPPFIVSIDLERTIGGHPEYHCKRTASFRCTPQVNVTISEVAPELKNKVALITLVRDTARSEETACNKVGEPEKLTRRVNNGGTHHWTKPLKYTTNTATIRWEEAQPKGTLDGMYVFMVALEPNIVCTQRVRIRPPGAHGHSSGSSR